MNSLTCLESQIQQTIYGITVSVASANIEASFRPKALRVRRINVAEMPANPVPDEKTAMHTDGYTFR